MTLTAPLRPAVFWLAVIAITALSFFVFPGHTYLNADTQIWVPMLERIQNPVLFEKDIMVTRPQLAYSIYDEVTLTLVNYSPLDLEHALKLEQFVFRGLAIGGILLIALALGIPPAAAVLVASIFSLGVPGGLGMPTIEAEAVPRGFAMGLLLMATGLCARGRFAWAGISASAALLFHPTTAAPFWAVAIFAVLHRKARPLLLAPLLPALGLLLLLARFQAGAGEAPDLLRQLSAFDDQTLRAYTPGAFVSEWSGKSWITLAFISALVVVGFWRLRERIRPGAVRDFLWGLPAVAIASVPLSWMLLDQMHWALIASWQPVRALVFVELLAVLLSAVCGILAAEKQRWLESGAWLLAAMVLPAQTGLFSWFVSPLLILSVVALAGAAWGAAWFARRTHGMSWIAAAALPFLLLPLSKGSVFEDRDTPELRELAAWAKSNTDLDSTFLFADSLYPAGVFRPRAERALYVDYEGRGQLNYFPQFAAEWERRWRDTQAGHWRVTAADFPRLAELHTDYVVVRVPVAGRQAAFQNGTYYAYRVAY